MCLSTNRHAYQSREFRLPHVKPTMSLRIPNKPTIFSYSNTFDVTNSTISYRHEINLYKTKR